MIKVSAPGKIHLIGEHAVVYGEPALLAAINQRTFVEISPSQKIEYLDLAWPDNFYSWSQKEIFEITERVLKLWQDCQKRKDFSQLFNFIKRNNYQAYLASLLGIVMKKLGIREGFSLTLKSEIPPSVGLGSSASKAVSITKALSEFFNKKISLEKINEIAFSQEKIIHGSPSGGDNTTCCFGGLVWFRKSQSKNEIKFLKKEIPYQLPGFVLINTGKPKKTTGEMIQIVRDLEKEYREKRIREIGKMSYEMVEALKRKDLKRMAEIITLTQKRLKELKVSTREIDHLVEAIQKINGAAKISGAGGGGIVLAYHENKEKLINLIKSFNYPFWETKLGVEGVRVESC